MKWLWFRFSSVQELKPSEDEHVIKGVITEDEESDIGTKVTVKHKNNKTKKDLNKIHSLQWHQTLDYAAQTLH